MDFDRYTQYPPVDSELVDKIVCKLKAQGIFDKFRKDCLADVDTKPAYQNLQQRVNGTVATFLTKHEWRHDLNKNQLRESLRRHVQQGFLEVGVDRIVEQVVNPKIGPIFLPCVEDVVYNCLGIEKPKPAQKKTSPQRVNPDKKLQVTRSSSPLDLLPKDLDPVSPESDHNMNDSGGPEENGVNGVHEESVTRAEQNEVSNDSHLSGISELTSHGSVKDISESAQTTEKMSFEMSSDSFGGPKTPVGPCENSKGSEPDFDNFSNLKEKLMKSDPLSGKKVTSDEDCLRPEETTIKEEEENLVQENGIPEIAIQNGSKELSNSDDSNIRKTLDIPDGSAKEKCDDSSSNLSKYFSEESKSCDSYYNKDRSSKNRHKRERNHTERDRSSEKVKILKEDTEKKKLDTDSECISSDKDQKSDNNSTDKDSSKTKEERGVSSNGSGSESVSKGEEKKSQHKSPNKTERKSSSGHHRSRDKKHSESSQRSKETKREDIKPRSGCEKKEDKDRKSKTGQESSTKSRDEKSKMKSEDRSKIDGGRTKESTTSKSREEKERSNRGERKEKERHKESRSKEGRTKDGRGGKEEGKKETEEGRVSEERRRERERKRRGERCKEEVKQKEARRSTDRDSNGRGSAGTNDRPLPEQAHTKDTSGNSHNINGSSNDKNSCSDSLEETVSENIEESSNDIDIILQKINSSIVEEPASVPPESLPDCPGPAETSEQIRKPKIAKNIYEIRKIMQARKNIDKKRRKDFLKKNMLKSGEAGIADENVDSNNLAEKRELEESSTNVVETESKDKTISPQIMNKEVNPSEFDGFVGFSEKEIEEANQKLHIFKARHECYCDLLNIEENESITRPNLLEGFKLKSCYVLAEQIVFDNNLNNLKSQPNSDDESKQKVLECETSVKIKCGNNEIQLKRDERLTLNEVSNSSWNGSGTADEYDCYELNESFCSELGESKPISLAMTEAMLDNLMKESNMISGFHIPEDSDEDLSDEKYNSYWSELSPTSNVVCKGNSPEEDSQEKTRKTPKRKRRSSHNQRYEDTDLYKPRPILPQTSRRKLSMNEGDRTTSSPKRQRTTSVKRERKKSS